MRTEPNPEITEETRVKVKMGTAWTIIASIVATAIWLTAVLLRIHSENQFEHQKLMLGLTELNTRSQQWVTRQELEESLVFVACEVLDTNMTYSRQLQVRDGLRSRLRPIVATP